MDTLGALCASLPSIGERDPLAGVVAAMGAQSGSARVAYASLSGWLPGAETARVLARYVRTAHARRAGVHSVTIQKSTVRFALPHPNLPHRRVSVRATQHTADVSGFVYGSALELARTLERSLLAAGVTGAFELVSVRCCQVYWYTGVRTDVAMIDLPVGGAWELVGRGDSLKVRTVSGSVSACVYANGTVSFVAKCGTQLMRAHAELLAAMMGARASESVDSGRVRSKAKDRSVGYNAKTEGKREDGSEDGSDQEEDSVSDDDDGDFEGRCGRRAPRGAGGGGTVRNTAIAKTRRRARGGVELRDQARRGVCDLRLVGRDLRREGLETAD
jgi:hypothetical protein